MSGAASNGSRTLCLFVGFRECFCLFVCLFKINCTETCGGKRDEPTQLWIKK